MTRLIADISVSLDGFVAGPDPSDDEPLGTGGEQLHDWVFAARAWREQHGRRGGEANADDAIVREHLDRIGATIMGRRMFSGGEGPWQSDGHANGWWGDEPPFRHPVFVLTHHEREPLALTGTTFTFVTGGIEAAYEQARAAAGAKDVHVAGGAIAVQEALRAGLLHELQLHVAPVLLGSGARLLDGDLGATSLRCTRAVNTDAVTHLRYEVRRRAAPSSSQTVSG